MTVCGGGTFWSPVLPLPLQEEMQQNELIGGECVGVGGEVSTTDHNGIHNKIAFISDLHMNE